MEEYLRCYIDYQLDNWTDLLPFVEVVYNNSVHSSTRFTPFKVVIGQDFVSVTELPQVTLLTASLKDQVVQLQSTWPVVRKVFNEVREAYKNRLLKSALSQRTLKWETRSIYLTNSYNLDKIGAEIH